MKKRLIFTLLSFAVFMVSQAQEQTDNYLQEIAKVVKELRKSNNSTRNSAIVTLSAEQKPKVTLWMRLNGPVTRRRKQTR